MGRVEIWCESFGVSQRNDARLGGSLGVVSQSHSCGVHGSQTFPLCIISITPKKKDLTKCIENLVFAEHKGKEGRDTNKGTKL